MDGVVAMVVDGEVVTTPLVMVAVTVDGVVLGIPIVLAEQLAGVEIAVMVAGVEVAVKVGVVMLMEVVVPPVGAGPGVAAVAAVVATMMILAGVVVLVVEVAGLAQPRIRRNPRLRKLEVGGPVVAVVAVALAVAGESLLT